MDTQSVRLRSRLLPVTHGLPRRERDSLLSKSLDCLLRNLHMFKSLSLPGSVLTRIFENSVLVQELIANNLMNPLLEKLDPQFEQIDLRLNGWPSMSLLSSAISKLPGLTRIEIWTVQIKELAAAMACCPLLHTVALTNNQSTDRADLDPIRSMSQLRNLTLQVSCSEDLVDIASSLTQLESLAVTAKGTSPSDLSKLNGHTLLESVKLIAMSSSGGDPIASLWHRTNLTSLDLEGTQLGQNGDATIGQCTRLQKLRITCAPHLSSLAGLVSLTNLQQFALVHAPKVRDVDLSVVSHWTNLTDLQVERCPMVTGDFLKGLTDLVDLQTLRIELAPRRANLTHLARMTNLRALALDDVELTESMRRSVASLTWLEELSLVGSSINSTQCQDIINRNKQLRLLNLSDTPNITGLSVKLLPHLQVLYLDRSPAGSNTLAEELLAHKDFELLSITNGHKISPDTLDKLRAQMVTVIS